MNPFSYGTIVKGNDFYDRKEECERIVSTLSNGNNIVLFAPRRYGKTSLVFRAMELMESQGIVCIYFDFMPVYSIEVFVNGFLHAIGKKQTNLQKFMQIVSTVVKNIRPKLTFDTNGVPEFGVEWLENKVTFQTLSEVLDLPEKLAQKGKKIVVIFDEFQEITKFDKIGFENLMRSKVQQQDVNYLFLGSRTHLLMNMFTNKKRAFYNSASHLQLNKLPQDDSINFLQKKFSASNIVIDTETAIYLLQEAGDIPYYIQLLAAEIWQYMITSLTVVTVEIVSLCANRIVELKSDYYFELFDRQSVMQKQLLKALVFSGENVFSVGYAKQFRLSAASTIQKAILVLMDSGIIDRSMNTYFISDPFFSKFIQNYT